MSPNIKFQRNNTKISYCVKSSSNVIQVEKHTVTIHHHVHRGPQKTPRHHHGIVKLPYLYFFITKFTLILEQTQPKLLCL